MFKLWSTILKDVRVLARDRVGVLLMFVMPIILAIVITAIQNSTFEMVNNNKVSLLICNKDYGESGKQLVDAITKVGMFDVKQVPQQEEANIASRMHDKDALLAIVIPTNFSREVGTRADAVAAKALSRLGLQGEDSNTTKPAAVDTAMPITLMYHPVLQQSFRASIQGALRSALQIVESKRVLKSLYFSLNEKEMEAIPDDEFAAKQIAINEIPVSRDGSRKIPNATQHNIPAWTVFAMFFIVVSLGSSVVREKLNGSFIRLKTLPTSYVVALLSKQITYVAVALLQAAVIFSIGVWLFPSIGLPQLVLPHDWLGLFIVAFMCGWCAVSFAICIGVYAQTQEQANGLGAVSIVLLAAIGGLLVPSFAMPASFQVIMKLSPLHWCLEAFYGLFLEGGQLKDVLRNILPLFVITLIIQAVALIGLKQKKLI